jgi:hypothetical protein
MFRACLLFLALMTRICVWPLAAQTVPGGPSAPHETHSSQPAQVETPVLSLVHLDQIFRYGRIQKHDDCVPEFSVERASRADAGGIILPFEYLPQWQQVSIDEDRLARGAGGDACKLIPAHYTY